MTERKNVELNDSGKKILAAAERAPYDTEAINLIKDKQYLAWILKECTTEFRGMKIKNIIPYIEDPLVGVVPVEPGLTNLVIMGMPTESKVIKEGLVTYDVRFFARNPKASKRKVCKKISIRLLVDVELQKDMPTKYDLVTRGILYGGRMLSEQMGREVKDSDYDALQKVYSIWVCMNCPPESANTITRYSLKQDILYSRTKKKALQARYDLLQVVVIRLPAEKEEDGKAKGKAKREETGEDKLAVDPPTELMRILSTLFSKKMPYQKKIDRLTELGIVLTEEMKKGINVMCNLSEGIFEAGVAHERAETERERARAEQERARAERECAEKERERARADKLQAENEELRAQLEAAKKKQR